VFRFGEVANIRTALYRRCAVAIYTAVFSSVQLSPSPSKLTSHASTSGVTVAQEPITPVPDAVITDLPKVRLGERLFRDTRLSHDNSRSCATCHDLQKNGASATIRDVGLDGVKLPLNTPTIFNATLNFRLGWEGKLQTLGSDIKAALDSPQIMATSFDEVLQKLNADPGVRREFTMVYGRRPDVENVVDAIVSFEQTLLTPGSRFDRWLGGDAAALSAEELDGYRLFKSLGCVSCHQGVNIGGNLFQRHGIFRPLASPQPEILRVPSLRNVATTPPYFHDGSAPTLDDAVRKMGAAQLNSTLTDQQVTAIVAYLQTLTGQYRGAVVGASP
jgi:cytochrome c peroxidase